MIRVVAAIIIVTLFISSFGLHSSVINGYTIYYPFPDPLHNISVQLTYFMRDTLLPQDVELIQTAPGQAFFAQIYVSLLIGIIIAIPVIIKEVVGFISPAIETNKEGKKKFLSVISISSYDSIVCWGRIIFLCSCDSICTRISL